MFSEIEKKIRQHFSSEIESKSILVKKDVLAAKIGTFGLGANIPLLFEIDSLLSMSQFLKFLYENKFPYRIVGRGSNIVFPDVPLNFIVLKLGRFFKSIFPFSIESKASYTTEELDIITNASNGGVNSVDLDYLCFGGASLMNLSRESARLGLSGLEFASGIPASISGAIVMNAGAHNQDISSIVKEVFYLDPEGNLVKLINDECKFSYRKSIFSNKADDYSNVVVASVLSFKKGDRLEIDKRREECLSYRKSTQPLSFPSCGSVFKNPTGYYAAELIEEAGLKGLRKEGLEVSQMHANWIIRRGDASANDLKDLIGLIKQKVKENRGVVLEEELIFW